MIAVRAWDSVLAPEGTEAGVAELLATAVLRGQRRRPGTDVEVEARVRIGDPKLVLVEESAGAELVVASARGDEPWRGMLGAVSQALLFHCAAPVVIVRGAQRTLRSWCPARSGTNGPDRPRAAGS